MLASPPSTLRRIVDEDVATILRTDLPWHALDGAVVLITGAGGFLPSYMVETLLAMREQLGFGPKTVFGLVRNHESARRRFVDHVNRTDLILLQGDVRDPLPPVAAAADVIIHAASPATPRIYMSDPTGVLDANLLGTRAMLEAARVTGARALFVSSGEVYGSTDTVPTGEEDYGYLDLAAVRTCYGEAKRAAEAMCVAWAHQHGVHVSIVRPFHTYGPGVALDDGRVFADFVADIIDGRDIVMRSEGTATRAFCYVGDAVAGFFSVLLVGGSGVAYNVGNPGATLSIAELAQLLVELVPEKKLKVIRDLAPRSDGYAVSPIDCNAPAITRARSLGWEPHTTPQEGFMRMIRSYQ